MLHSNKWQTLLLEGAHELGIPITPFQAHQFVVYAQELINWNKKFNITAITDPFEIAVKHFLDAIAPATRIPHNISLIDIGSGGGFPGIPLKLVIPSISVTLIDASRKKVNFLKQIIRILELEKIEALHTRVEDMVKDPVFIKKFDVSISRAFSNLNRFFELSAPLVKPGGKMIAMKAKKALDEVKGLEGETEPILIHYHLPFLKDNRAMVILVNHS